MLGSDFFFWLGRKRAQQVKINRFGRLVMCLLNGKRVSGCFKQECANLQKIPTTGGNTLVTKFKLQIGETQY